MSAQQPGTPVVGVLGPLRAGIGGRALDLGGPRQRAVLAWLVAAGGHVVPTALVTARSRVHTVVVQVSTVSRR